MRDRGTTAEHIRQNCNRSRFFPHVFGKNYVGFATDVKYRMWAYDDYTGRYSRYGAWIEYVEGPNGRVRAISEHAEIASVIIGLRGESSWMK